MKLIATASPAWFWALTVNEKAIVVSLAVAVVTMIIRSSIVTWNTGRTLRLQRVGLLSAALDDWLAHLFEALAALAIYSSTNEAERERDAARATGLAQLKAVKAYGLANKKLRTAIEEVTTDFNGLGAWVLSEQDSKTKRLNRMFGDTDTKTKAKSTYDAARKITQMVTDVGFDKLARKH